MEVKNENNNKYYKILFLIHKCAYLNLFDKCLKSCLVFCLVLKSV